MPLIGKLIRNYLFPRKGYVLEHVQGPLLHSLLVGKLHEEVEELSRDQERPDEYGDVLEVLLTLAKLNGLKYEDIQQAMIRKREQLGGFDQGNYVKRDKA